MTEIIVVISSDYDFYRLSLIADYIQQITRIGYFFAIPYFIESYLHINSFYSRINNLIFRLCKAVCIILLLAAAFLPELYINSLVHLKNSSPLFRGDEGIIYIISEALLFPLLLYLGWVITSAFIKGKRTTDLLTLMTGIILSVYFFSSAISKSLLDVYFPPFQTVEYSRTNMGFLIFTVSIIWGIFRMFLTRARETEKTREKLVVSEKKLYSMVYIDKLTGLPNRHAFFRDAHELAASGSLKGTSLILININNFRDINESYGNTEGDNILVEIANIFISRLSQRQTVYRIGGDEFAFFNPFSENEKKCIENTLIVQKWISEPLITENHAYSLDSRAGLFRAADDSASVDDMLKNCSSALQKARMLKTGLTVFNTSLKDESVSRIRMVMDLKEGIRYRQFFLVYQPIVDRDGKITSMEALIRWSPMGRQVISPADFIPVAETAGLMQELGELILDLFIRDHKMIREFLPDVTVSLNISPAQLTTSGLYEFIRDSFEYHGVDTSLIQFEVTETTFITNYNRVFSMMNKFRKMGIRVALDDFGTGYSSLQHLQRMPVDVLKIDKSFLDDITENEQSVSIVKSIVDLSSALNLKTIAEGIEDSQQYQILKSLGCGHFQGYYFYKPLNLRELKQLVEEDL
ncbi:MAG: bifunctional diguanylate cyclase/phosphodiesterase [Spirochaetales bacterium]|nr:bifunctional diguanylate cyclase/phosphodiesterase [Spirochaetales bacterium]